MEPIAVRWREESRHYESLVVCLRSLLAGAGRDCAYRDLTVALGLGGLLCAHAHEPLGWWWTVARDARLACLAGELGIELRPLHPPEAAVEYEPTPEYTQHFRDSYVPLIEQALDHGHPVLVWGGWPAPRERLWGVITQRRSGMLVGLTLWHNGQPMPLISAARGVYIVEDVRRDAPPWTLAPDALERIARWTVEQWHARWLDATCVQTGLPAWQRWIAALRQPPQPHDVPLHRQHAQLARVTAAARTQLAAWLRSVGPRLRARQVDLAAHWAAQCDAVASLLTTWSADEAARHQFEKPTGPHTIAATLQTAATIEGQMVELLQDEIGRQPNRSPAGRRKPGPRVS